MQISRVFSKFSQNCPSPAGTCNYLDDVTRDDFQRNTTFQRCCDIVSNVCNIVPTFRYAVLRKKSSLRIVQCNITLKGKSYVCLDICGGIGRASSRGHRAGMQGPQKFYPLCDEQVTASTLGSKNYPKSIGRDAEFLSSGKVVEGKARRDKDNEKGKKQEYIQLAKNFARAAYFSLISKKKKDNFTRANFTRIFKVFPKLP